MVGVVLVGVPPGELHRRVAEPVPLPEVGGDGHRVAGAGVGPGQGLAAGGGELGQDGGDQLDRRDDLHVAELADVVVVAAERAPAHEDVGGRLDQALAGDDPLAVVAVDARPEVGLVDGRTACLHCRNSGSTPLRPSSSTR